MKTSLRDAVQSADLPAILERLYPTCGARAGKRGRVRCVWRGGEDLSGSLYRSADGGWRLHDFVTDQTWNAYSALVEIGGLTRSQAARELVGTGARPRQQRQRRQTVRQKVEIAALPAFPDELLLYILVSRITGKPLWPVDAIPTGQGRRALELLGEWIANCLRPPDGPDA